MSEPWEDKLSDLLHRILATAAANGDPRPLQEEYNLLLPEIPANKREEMGLTTIPVTAMKKRKR